MQAVARRTPTASDQSAWRTRVRPCFSATNAARICVERGMRAGAILCRFLTSWTSRAAEEDGMATTVEVLAAAFKEAGTPFIVGHPGGESVELMEAGRQRQMRFLLMKQEVAGAMLAATWGEITGSPGICMSTRGPGATNMVNGVAHAYLDRSPLIAITDTYSAPTYET